jgi:FAD/FMN-containing dehydrogenase
MSAIEFVKKEGGKINVAPEVVEGFAAGRRGETLRPGDPDYESSRQIWNAMIDRRPALIARCRGASDVIRSVDFAREHGLLMSVRGGGHNIAGNAVCDGGLMIDLSPMNAVRIDPSARRAHVGPGATLGDLDREAQAFGLATPTGINSTTGIAGLTLGGGFGWLSRKLGMTADNLVAADVVTADGKLLRADESENPDLFWAIRGGGGNFGIVTRFEFDLHPVGPQVLSGLLVYPFAEAKSVLQQYRQFAAQASEDVNVWAVMRKAPPLPFLEESVHGKEILVLALCHIGESKTAEREIAPLRSFGTVLGEHVGVQPFTAWQTAFDPLLAPGVRNYWKSHNLSELSDGAIDVLVDSAGKLPSEQCEVLIVLLGGQVNRVEAGATAYAHRQVNFIMNVHGRWDDARDDERCMGWARGVFREVAPFSDGGVYVNFLTEEETERVRGAYGSGYDRLVRVKERYDPDNLFRMNQNIRPGGQA